MSYAWKKAIKSASKNSDPQAIKLDIVLSED